MNTIKCHSSYLHTALHPQLCDKAIKLIAKIINKTIGMDSFDAVAFTGMSGALFVPKLCQALGKNMIMVRKDTDNSHSTYKVEGMIDSERIIIVDDVVCTGHTISRLLDKLLDYKEQWGTSDLKIIAAFLYHDYGSWSNIDMENYVAEKYKSVMKGVNTYGFRLGIQDNNQAELYCSVPVRQALGLKETQRVNL